MDEYAKIASLLQEGKINPDEAEKLLAALDDVEPAPTPVASGGLLRARVGRADLLVRVDPAASEPRFKSPAALELELRKEEDGWSLKQKSGGLRVGFFDLLGKRHGVELTLPPGFSLDLHLGQGKLRVADPLPGLRAKIGQGSASFATVEEVDVRLGQGPIEGRARLTSGVHQLGLGMGSLKLTLEKGSDLTLQIKTGMGKINVGGAIRYASEKPASRYEGVVAEGRGRLEVSVGMGKVEVEVQ